MTGISGAISCCASCGVKEGEGNDVKLKLCTACKSARYCGIKCQKDHRKEHKRDCKERAAELREEILFRQPESSHFGDCPICFLPLPLSGDKFGTMPCCSKVICNGCSYSNQKREFEEKLGLKCPFCRKSFIKSETEVHKRLKDRADMNDVVAMHHIGTTCLDGGDYPTALKYFSKATELGDAGAHFDLAKLYHLGQGVDKDELKSKHHFEQAAIGGHPVARQNLGSIEWNNGSRERAIKHWMIAAKLGHDDSLDELKTFYKAGIVSKDDFAAALRGHQAAVDATKSPQRDEVEAFVKREVLK